MNRIHIGADIPEALDEEIRFEAARLKISRSELLRRVLWGYFNKSDDRLPDREKGQRKSQLQKQ